MLNAGTEEIVQGGSQPGRGEDGVSRSIPISKKDEEGRDEVIPFSQPLPGSGQLAAGNVPSVQGTPQMSGIPQVQGNMPIGHGIQPSSPPTSQPVWMQHQSTSSVLPPQSLRPPSEQDHSSLIQREIQGKLRGPQAQAPHVSTVTGAASKATVGGMAKWIIISVATVVVVAGAVKVAPLVLHTGNNFQSKAPIVTTKPVPPTQTSCPAIGKARAAVTALLVLGKDQNIVYFEDEPQEGGQPDIGVIKRYDVADGHTTQIVSLHNEHITEAQISADGQWILFTGNSILTNSPLLSKLQMVRMDGQGLQTLYCITADISSGGIYNIQWSPDQKTIVFDQDQEGTPRSIGNMYLIDTVNGNIQLEIATPTYNLGDQPVTLLNNTLIYVDIDGQHQPFFILDTKKGANQQISDLQPFVNSVFPCENIDRFITSSDGTKLIFSQCSNQDPTNLVPMGPYSISVEPIGGSPHVIYSSPTLIASKIRIISSTSMLLFMNDRSSTTQTSQDGLWTMNIDGSNLKKVISFSELDKAIGVTSYDQQGIQNELIDNQFTRNPWSIVSRNGSMYAIQTWLLTGDPPCKLLVGSLSGGSFTTVVSSNSRCDFDYAFQSPYGTGSTHLGMVGWTTM